MMYRESGYILNKVKFYLEKSSYEDNFMITNVDFNYYYTGNFATHFARWFNDGNDNYIVMVNTSERERQLINAGVDEKMILLRTDYTKMRKYRDESKMWMYDYLTKGKVIMYDVADVRLFEHQKFYFGLSKKNVDDKLSRHISYHSTGHKIEQTFERLFYLSEKVKNSYHKKLNRLRNIEKVLNS